MTKMDCKLHVTFDATITRTAWMQLLVKRKKSFKKAIGFVTHMKWQEVYFDSKSAVGHAWLGSKSVSESLHTYSSPTPTTAN